MAKNIQYYARKLHRVLGFLAVGLLVVYAVSGITLIYRGGDFLKREVLTETVIDSGLEADQLGEVLKIKRLKVLSETDSTIIFEQGRYDRLSGAVSYTVRETVAPVNHFVELHKMSDSRNRHIAFVTTFFGVVLLLLAITPIFMYKPGTRQFRNNMILLCAGVAVAVILLAVI